MPQDRRWTRSLKFHSAWAALGLIVGVASLTASFAGSSRPALSTESAALQLESNTDAFTVVVAPGWLAQAAVHAERESSLPLQAEIDRAMREVVFFGLNGMLEWFHHEKWGASEAQQGVLDLMIDLAVMQRFEAPTQEFLLSFDKSVQLRMHTFRRQLQSGPSFPNSPLPPGWPDQEAPDWIPTYARSYPLPLETPGGRQTALAWIYLIHRDAAIESSFRRLLELAEIAWGTPVWGWKDVLASAEGLDPTSWDRLTSPDAQKRFESALRTRWSERFESNTAAPPSLPSLALLPYPDASWDTILQPLHERRMPITFENLYEIAQSFDMERRDDLGPEGMAAIRQARLLARDAWKKGQGFPMDEWLLAKTEHGLSVEAVAALWVERHGRWFDVEKKEAESDRPVAPGKWWVSARSETEFKGWAQQFRRRADALRTIPSNLSHLAKPMGEACREWADVFDQLAEIARGSHSESPDGEDLVAVPDSIVERFGAYFSSSMRTPFRGVYLWEMAAAEGGRSPRLRLGAGRFGAAVPSDSGLPFLPVLGYGEAAVPTLGRPLDFPNRAAWPAPGWMLQLR